MTKKELLILRELDTKKAESFMKEELLKIGCSNLNKMYVISYVVVKASLTDGSDISTFESFINTCNINDEIMEFISSELMNCWSVVIKAFGMFDVETFKAILIFSELNELKSDNYSTPTGVARLIMKLLEIRDEDYVADFCIGRGSFIRECFIESPKAKYFGNDINVYIKNIAEMRAEILNGNIEIKNEDALQIRKDKIKFDKIFANYPLAMRLVGENTSALQYLNKVLPTIKRVGYADWLFNTAIVKSLNTNGKGAAIVTPSVLWSESDKDVRKYFIDNKYIEAVIALPNKLFEYISVKTYIVIFSNKENNVVKFINAQNFSECGRRINVITDENIEKIIKLYKTDGENSRLVSISEIMEKEYNLEPNKYLYNKIAIENGVPFESVIKNITRGAQIKAAELDKIVVTDRETDYQFLMLADIQNGLINDNLSYISGVEKNQIKYCLKNNSLIISKNGTPVKTAIAKVKEGQTILANGNMYIIELDESKINPYFLKAFFESEKGKTVLSGICDGGVISSISLESLKNMIVPVPEMNKQNKIAEKYLTSVEKIIKLRNEIRKTEKEIESIYESNI